MVLALDSCTHWLTIGLWQVKTNPFELGFGQQIQIYCPFQQSQFLAKQTNQLLNTHKDELKAIVVGAGPGSFMGMRIGLSFAKGLAYVHQVPLYLVSTLKAYAQNMDPAYRYLCLIPSKQGHFYCSAFDQGRALWENQNYSEKQILTWIEKHHSHSCPKIILLGSGRSIWQEKYPHCGTIEPFCSTFSQSLISLALQGTIEKNLLYLSATQAELNFHHRVDTQLQQKDWLE